MQHDLNDIEGSQPKEESVRDHLGQARLLFKQWTEAEMTSIQDIVRQDFDNYESHSMRLVQALEERGYGDRGLIGGGHRDAAGRSRLGKELDASWPRCAVWSSHRNQHWLCDSRLGSSNGIHRRGRLGELGLADRGGVVYGEGDGTTTFGVVDAAFLEQETLDDVSDDGSASTTPDEIEVNDNGTTED